MLQVPVMLEKKAIIVIKVLKWQIPDRVEWQRLSKPIISPFVIYSLYNALNYYNIDSYYYYYCYNLALQDKVAEPFCGNRLALILMNIRPKRKTKNGLSCLEFYLTGHKRHDLVSARKSRDETKFCQLTPVFYVSAFHF